MEKYENMVLQNKEKSNRKVEIAVSAIKEMINKNQKVTVCELTKKTGLSRSFFYNNIQVKAELSKAKELQKDMAFVEPQRAAINKAMERDIEVLKKMLGEKERKIIGLEKEVEKLQRIIKERTLKLVKEL